MWLEGGECGCVMVGKECACVSGGRGVYSSNNLPSLPSPLSLSSANGCSASVPPVQPPAAGEGEECSTAQDLGADHGHSTHRAAATEAPREGEAAPGVYQSCLCVCIRTYVHM